MHIHILGICGTFMGGIAQLAQQAGHRVSGSDEHVYPPMSTQLQASGISLSQGYHPEHLQPPPDCVVVGNVMSRGNPAIEYLLNHDLPYVSGPEWLKNHVLKDRWVLAVAGTHGKTSTASLLAWLLEYAGLEPGFLIGGVPRDFGLSARLGKAPYFVVEADEYDTAFFDKRSKFVHYRPRTLVLNNLEFDHADIFDDLAAIKRQFHHLLRIIPGEGLVINNAGDTHLNDVLSMGCWTPRQGFALADKDVDWSAQMLNKDGSNFELMRGQKSVGEVKWTQLGNHNVANALAAVAAACHAGVSAAQAIEALAAFKGVKRRMEVWGQHDGITLYDDFAHHPTAIKTTLAGLRARVGKARIFAVLEPRSNTMRQGVHKGLLADSLTLADRVFIYRPPDLDWSLARAVDALGDKAAIIGSVDTIIQRLVSELTEGDHVLIMSNGGFGGLHMGLDHALRDRG
ncbi:MAG: UDP-N-acetylmuramate:L-alanyl-gamma-D-glutamyl-meso-diaminopimelate ligase [Gammaproteobacteria bacterium]|nr:UDP-N-acetylmuramate:L-alanyl-gamma-D-glutamyl-meso-diaminopimelate ligase [Gammaproteobacteria bacterium]